MFASRPASRLSHLIASRRTLLAACRCVCRQYSVPSDAEAADAEVSAAAWASDFWPDGTPKKFTGRDKWKNWIEWDSRFTDQTDELNRARHYFFSVDSRGRLWRKELHQLEGHDGQLRDTKILDHFFGHMQRNTTGLYADLFPWVSFRMHEHYFAQCAEGTAPVVFTDFREGELRHLLPDGELARSVTTPLDPSALRFTADGKLYHPVSTKAVDEVGGPRRRETLMALVESTTAQQLLESCCASADDEDDNTLVLRWRSEEVRLQALPEGTDVAALSVDNLAAPHIL